MASLALQIADDPHPERGARKGLTSEGATLAEIAGHAASAMVYL
jgi:hypothetical protein